jgi:hypothetical protein
MEINYPSFNIIDPDDDHIINSSIELEYDLISYSSKYCGLTYVCKNNFLYLFIVY